MHTVRDHLMSIAMTGRAVDLGMLAFMLLELGHLVGMTGQAGLGEVVINRDYQWRMRVVMTGGTVVEFEMRASFMALATFGNYVVT